MSMPFIGQIRPMSFGFAPKGWAQCNGQLLPINQNQALYSVLGTTYGGDGSTTFGLPNMDTRSPLHIGSFNGNSYVPGESAGEAAYSLTGDEVPLHIHMLMADATTPETENSNSPDGGSVLGQSGGHSSDDPFPVNIYSTDLANLAKAAPAMVGNAGAGQPHENRQPFLALNFCIALQGIFPTRQ